MILKWTKFQPSKVMTCIRALNICKDIRELLLWHGPEPGMIEEIWVHDELLWKLNQFHKIVRCVLCELHLNISEYERIIILKCSSFVYLFTMYKIQNVNFSSCYLQIQQNMRLQWKGLPFEIHSSEFKLDATFRTHFTAIEFSMSLFLFLLYISFDFDVPNANEYVTL